MCFMKFVCSRIVVSYAMALGLVAVLGIGPDSFVAATAAGEDKVEPKGKVPQKEKTERGRFVSFQDSTLTIKANSGALLETKIPAKTTTLVWNDEEGLYKPANTTDALSQAKASGKRANCISNLHQMGIGLLLYADESDNLVPRGNNPIWWQVLSPKLGGRSTNDYRRVRIYTCPSYPDKTQLICYVANSWQFSSPLDMVGFELTGLSKMTRVKKPAETIYLADNEYGSWRPLITDLGIIGSDQKNDVWSPSHLPYAPGGVTLNPERRVALARHGRGPVLLYFDGHAGLKKARLITVDDWREDRR